MGTQGNSRQFMAQDKGKYCWCMNYNANIIFNSFHIIYDLSLPSLNNLWRFAQTHQEELLNKPTSPLCVTLYYCATESEQSVSDLSAPVQTSRSPVSSPQTCSYAQCCCDKRMNSTNAKTRHKSFEGVGKYSVQ